MAIGKGKGVKASGLKKVSYGKKEATRVLTIIPLPCEAKKAVALLWQWVKDRVICYQWWNSFLPSSIKKTQGTSHTTRGMAIHMSDNLGG